MSYLSLARKYRPRRFVDMVGQEAITLALTNAIRLRREPHSVIFTGVRGVGKTTTARIYAKALNCEQGPTAEPCDVCQSCLAIQDGTHEDVLEIDGASNTGVDDVRALQETLGYVPQRSTYKIYIIDEVHMLSISAFNALLKTLEEPPDHVVFIFATTELHKVPETIQSRCQTFHLQKISRPVISSRLGSILEAEGIASDPEALAIVAREGRGSLRDALTLLDQVIALGGGQVSLAALQHAIGNSRSQPILDLLVALLERQAKQAIEAIAAWDQEGLSMSSLVEELAKTCRNAFILREWKGESLDLHILELEEKEQQTLLEIAQKSAPFDLNRLFRSFTKCLDDLRHADLDRYVVENYALEWCLDPGLPDLQHLPLPSAQDGRAAPHAAQRSQAAQDPGLGLKDRWKNQAPATPRPAQASAGEARPPLPPPVAAPPEQRNLAATLKDSLKAVQGTPARALTSAASAAAPGVASAPLSPVQHPVVSNGAGVAPALNGLQTQQPQSAAPRVESKPLIDQAAIQTSSPQLAASHVESKPRIDRAAIQTSSLQPAAPRSEAKATIEQSAIQASPSQSTTTPGAEIEQAIGRGAIQTGSQQPVAAPRYEAKATIEQAAIHTSPSQTTTAPSAETKQSIEQAVTQQARQSQLATLRTELEPASELHDAFHQTRELATAVSPAAALNLLAAHVSNTAKDRDEPKAQTREKPSAPSPGGDAGHAKVSVAKSDSAAPPPNAQASVLGKDLAGDLRQSKHNSAPTPPLPDIPPWDEEPPLDSLDLGVPLFLDDQVETLTSEPMQSLAEPLKLPDPEPALKVEPSLVPPPLPTESVQEESKVESNGRFPATWRDFVEEWKKQKPLQARVVEETYVLEYGPERIRLAVEQQSMAGAKLLQPDMRKRFLAQFEQLFGFQGQLDVIATTDVKGAAQETAKPLGESLLEVKQREREVARDKLRKDLEQHPLTREVIATFGGTIETIELT